MPQEIVVNITSREVRVALLDEGVLQDIYIERKVTEGLVGNIYKGRVTRLLPGIQAAFVDIGLDRAAFLHLSDIDSHPNASSDIRVHVKPGQDILVQVYKNPLGSKGARLTTHFSIPFRYIVLTPGAHQIAVSQKITDEVERQRLLALLTPSEAGGYIFRTAAQGVSDAHIQADKHRLEQLWDEIRLRAQKTKSAELIYAEIPIVQRVLRDFVSEHVDTIRVDNEDAFLQMREFAEKYIPNLVPHLFYYKDKRPIFDNYAIEDELKKALDSKVYLKSGGHIIFDQTEAMTTIDVNTGSYVGQSLAELATYKTNIEAVEVIARQLRLRNLGGIIIIDFIDMQDVEHKQQLLALLAATLAKDSVKIQMSELSSLGLVQLTRKRTRESLEHILCETCTLCQGRGAIKSVKTICYEIIREIKRASQYDAWPGFDVLAHCDVIAALSQNEMPVLAALEATLGKSIQLRIEPSYTQENYGVLPLSDRG